MKKYLLIPLFATLSGCSALSTLIASSWDTNQSKVSIDIRQSIAQLDCANLQIGDVKRIQDQVQWLSLYNESKETIDISRVTAPLAVTVDEFYVHTQKNPTSKVYCELKRKILSEQALIVSKAIIRRNP